MGLKNFQKKISHYSLIGIDTMCFIYQFEGNARFGPLVKNLFALLQNQSVTGITSSITLAEILSQKRIIENPEIIERDKRYFTYFPSLEIFDVDLIIAEQAAIFRAHYNLKLPDAIQFATAYLAGAEAFITNDEVFRRVRDFDVIILKDFIKKSRKEN